MKLARAADQAVDGVTNTTPQRFGGVRQRRDRAIENCRIMLKGMTDVMLKQLETLMTGFAYQYVWKLMFDLQ
jgi:hypothetical protein